MPLVSRALATPVPSERVVYALAPTVATRVEAALGRLGLRQTQASPAAIEAETRQASTDWASCPPVLASCGDDRKRMVSAEQRRAEVGVDLGPAGTDGSGNGTTVRVTASFAAGYRNPITGYSLERACRSRGVVEQTLLDAAAS